MRNVRWMCVCSLFFVLFATSGRGYAASATAATQAKHAAQMAAMEKLDPGSGAPAGRGADLRAISSPSKAPTTFTGMPAGTLPGGKSSGSGSGSDSEMPGHIALVGQPLLGAVSELDIGKGLDKIGTIADQVGYTLVPRKDYKPLSPTEPPYSYYLMNGKKRVTTLFFDCQLKLCDLR